MFSKLNAKNEMKVDDNIAAQGPDSLFIIYLLNAVLVFSIVALPKILRAAAFREIDNKKKE